MSLINDALRRATQKKHATNDLPAMEPIQRPQQSSGGPGLTVILICFVIAGAVMLGAWSYWNKKYKQPALERKKAAAAAAAKTNAPSAGGATNVASANSKTNNNPIARAANTLMKVQNANKDGEKTADAMQTTAAKPNPAPPTTSPAKPVQVAATPTSPPAVTSANVAAAAGLPKVQGIFYSMRDPSAIMNGKTVRAGEELNGYKIIEIKRNVVVVQGPRGVHELTVK